MTTHRSTAPGRQVISQTIGGENTPITPLARVDRGPCYRTFHAALARRDAAAVDVVAVGDSVTTGAQASVASKRWLGLLQTKLRGLYQPAGVAGGIGYVQMNSTYNSPWTLSNTTVPTTPSGLGQGALEFPSGATASATFTGTAVDVFYRKVSGGGSFSISIDGATTGPGFVTVNTANASEVAGSKQRIGSLTPGSHTITIANVSGTSQVEGVMFYNGDESLGIRTWDAGRSGIPSGGYVSNTRYLGAITTIQPQLVTVFLGINNYRNQQPPAALATDIISMIRSIRAACTIPPSILLVIPFLPHPGTANRPYLAYYDALLQAASTFPDVDVLDLYAKFGPTIQTQTLGLLHADLTHPNDAGYEFISESVLAHVRSGASS
ncbi:minor tail protein [Gordonia phage Sekhmet]|uniref:Minor tail protein n=1 Tax=Gordonia phage Sekhmet TaxID=2591209 RepID=A0A514DIC6_9CAUD|nr:tail protein [Gordonia phage Sekhmet]QDH93368.1 minor tail protein [Gordonia phage Sekhmet]